MKKLLKSLMLVAAAAMSLTSCENEIMNEGIDTNETFTLSFTAGAPESKTSVKIDGETATYSWSEGDEVAFIQWANGAEKINKNKSGAAAIDGKTATFTSSFSKVDGTVTSYDYAAIYPDANWSKSVSFAEVHAKLPAMQNLTASSFDPKADLMMSKAILGVAEKDGHGGNLEFTRIAAIGKMNLKLTDMVEGEVIESVKFAFAEGTHFNGPVVLDFVNSTYTLGTENTNNAVTLTGELAANTDRTEIFFTCFPGEYSGAYTIEVETDKAKYSKEGNLTNPLSFTAGDVLSFNATAANREEKIVAANEVVDVLNRDLTGITGTSYATWSDKTSNSDAIYAGQSAGGNESIQLRSNNSNSGIITTTSGGYAKKVVVTWHSSTSSGRTLNIYGKNSAYTAATDLYDSSKQGTKLGTIVCGTSTELVIDGDYEYIGMRSNSGAMYISEIEITWSSEAKPVLPTLDTPENLVYEIDEENIITVSWDEVANADRYILTVNGENFETEFTNYDIEGDWNTTYEISVVAVAEGYNNSAATTAITVEIGSDPNATGPQAITIAEFLKKTEDTNVWYQLTGTMLDIYNTTYGNFHLNDGVNDVVVYGLTATKVSSNDKSFASLNLAEGDIVTIIGTRSSYTDKDSGETTIQVGGPAYYVSHIAKPGVTVSTDNLSLKAEGESTTFTVSTRGEGTLDYTVAGNWITVTNTNDTYTVTAGANESEEARTATITFTYGGATATVTVSQNVKSTGDEPEKETAEATLSFADKAYRTSFSTSQQVWEQNNIKLQNDKAASTNAVADYAKPARFYAGSKVIVTAPGNITKIVFDCNSSSYATALKNSIGSTATTSVSSDKVTVTLDGSSNTFTIAKLTAQVRMDSLTVTYEK